MRTLILRSAAVLLALTTFMVAIPAQRPQTDPNITPLTRLPRGVTEAQLKTHVSAPENIKNIQIEETDPAREVKVDVPIKKKIRAGNSQLDVTAFAASLHASLKDNVAGYIMQIRQNGTLVYTNVWKWAQRPNEGNKGWNENTRMHVASVSKYLTAVAMVKLLDSKGISYDTKISQYLPTYWTKGINIDKISFRNLFQHSSGFVLPDSSCDYATMKKVVAAGVFNVGTASGYQNVNYSLMRILIAVIHGDVNKNAVFFNQPAINDQIWDGLTIGYYKEYMQDNVFTPSGVANASFAPPASGNALAYWFPDAIYSGWNSGDLQSVSGAAAWHLSVKELLNVINTVRRKNTIIPDTTAQYMLDNYFGIDQGFDTPAGKIYNKNGAWGDNLGRTEQSVAYFFPNQMEVVVFVNSPITPAKLSLRNTVKNAFEANLK